MAQDTLPLSVEEIDKISSIVDQPTSDKLYTVFNQEFQIETDPERKTALQLILSVLSLSLLFNSSDLLHPFGKVSKESFSDQQLDFFTLLALNLKTTDLKAVFADLVWLLRRADPQLARLAVKSYVATARLVESGDNWTSTAWRLERAFRLSRSLGYQDISFNEAKDFALELVHKYRGSDLGFLTGKVVELLLEFEVGSPADYVLYISDAAYNALQRKNFYLARFYFELLGKLQRALKEQQAVNEAGRSLARTFEAEAKEREAQSNHMAAAYFYTQAIQAFRRVPSSDSEVVRVRIDLERAELASVGQMKRIQSDPVDISNLVVKSRKHVSGLDLETAIRHLAYIVRLAQSDEIRQQATELSKISLVRKIATRVTVDAKGRKIGENFSALDDEISFGDLVEQMHWHRSLVAQAYIRPALCQMSIEHSISLRDMVSITFYSPFVPEGREMIFARGLMAGFEQDFLLSSHLLTPQIENSLRYLLRQEGIATTKIDRYGIQRERDLNDLLVDEETSKVLSADFILELRTLLSDNRGPNLRNALAHGMLSDGQFSTAECMYLWWLVLNLCLFGVQAKGTTTEHKI